MFDSMRVSTIVTLVCASLCAQEATRVDPNAAKEEAEWVQIREIKTIYEQAMSQGEIDRLRPYLAKGFRGVVLTAEEVKSFDEVKAFYDRIRRMIGAGGSYQVKVNYAPGVMFGNLAVAHGDTEDRVVTSGGKQFSFRTLWTVNLVKEQDGWKLYRIQASLDPLDNVFVRETVRYAKLLFGAGGFLAGLVVTGVGRMLMSKR